MKKIRPAIVISMVLLSATLSAQDRNPSQLKKDKEQTEKNREVVRKVYDECLNKGNLELLQQFVAETYTGPNGEKGAAGLMNTVKPLLAAFPDIHWTIEDLVAGGDRVCVRWTWQGTHIGTFRGWPPTGRKFTNTAIAIYQLRDEKIINAWLQTDRLGFLEQLGAVPENVVANPPKK